jgi:hypothetical protein
MSAEVSASLARRDLRDFWVAELRAAFMVPPRDWLQRGRSPGLRVIDSCCLPRALLQWLWRPRMSLGAYSYGVVAELHRASRYPAVVDGCELTKGVGSGV